MTTTTHHDLRQEALWTFLRDLPQLWAEHPGQWVAYRGIRQLGFAAHKHELYQQCFQLGMCQEDFVVFCIECSRRNSMEAHRPRGPRGCAGGRPQLRPGAGQPGARYVLVAMADPSAAALSQAQLAMIRALWDKNAAAHPFFWAAFTLTGQ